MADLRDAEGNLIASEVLPGEPTPKPKFGTFGDPQGFSCVSATKIEGWAAKASPDTLRAEVGTVRFEMAHGVRVIGRIIKVQRTVVEENGRMVGKGKLELSFNPAFSKTKPMVELQADSDEWRDTVLNAWKAYRDENKYPNILLTKPEAAAAASSVDD